MSTPWTEPLGVDDVVGEIGPSWLLSVVATKRRRGRTESPFSLMSPHLLVADDAALGMELGGDAPVAIGWPLGADLLDALDESGFLDRLRAFGSS
jgi:hypothetical protein